MKKTGVILWFLSAILTGCSSPKTDDAQTVQMEMQSVKQVLDNYKISINQADTVLAGTFWLTTPQASFIHPRGHEKGWEEIKPGIYGMFGSRFATRNLKSYDETIQLYDDMAVVVFYWIFDATFAGENPSPMQSRGRETMVLRKFENAWKVVHIHYSSMPVTGDRQGF